MGEPRLAEPYPSQPYIPVLVGTLVNFLSHHELYLIIIYIDVSNKGDQLRGELLLSSCLLLSGNANVSCREHRSSLPAAIQSYQGCREGGNHAFG